MRFKNKEAVSPVIGVILMVAITVILAAVLYLWVIGLVAPVKSSPTAILNSGTYTDNYIVRVESMNPAVSVKGISFQIIDPNGNVLCDLTSVNLVYGQDTVDSHVTFNDNDVDTAGGRGMVSGGDTFKISKATYPSGSYFKMFRAGIGQFTECLLA